MSVLQEVPLSVTPVPLPARAKEMIDEGLKRSKKIDCFDFVPSEYQTVYSVLSAIPAGRFCEWGSGMGIVTALAEMLSFEATGIEISEPMATASRQLLTEFGISAEILTGSYFDLACDADYYFTYCWPGQMIRVEAHFLEVAPQDARLLICHGAEDIRCKIRVDDEESIEN